LPASGSLGALCGDDRAMLDLSAIYAHYAPVGGEPFAPELMVGLLFYGYAAGRFSSRKIEEATYDSLSFRFTAGGWHPDHDTIANFRKTLCQRLQTCSRRHW
jgi:transposase